MERYATEIRLLAVFQVEDMAHRCRLTSLKRSRAAFEAFFARSDSASASLSLSATSPDRSVAFMFGAI